MEKTETKYSDKRVDCDFCPSDQAYLYTIETENSEQVITCCRNCKVKVPQQVVGFKQWLWPKRPGG